MMKYLIAFLLLPFLGQAQTLPPAFGIQDVFKDTLVLSWVIPEGGYSTVIERATNRDFTSATTVYNQANTTQILVERGLTEHTWYYYRCKAVTESNVSSAWTVDSVRTFWTPSAASQGGHRIATISDLLIDPFINVGDYLIVGSDSYAENDVWGAGVGGYSGLLVPQLAVGKKVCIIGDIGYDYMTIDMALNTQGTAANPVIITNIGGQLKGRLNFTNMRHVLFTGKYDPVKKTGNSRFVGFDKSDWSVLSGTFGFFIKGRWDHPEVLLSHMAGNTDSSTFEYMEAGMGGSVAFSIKNDNGTVPMKDVVLRYIYAHDSGDELFYIGSTQPYPQMPVENFHMHDIVATRAGLNAIQIGQMRKANRLHNNVTVGSGFQWNNAFMKWQDQAIQLQPRENGFRFDSNVVAGSSQDFLNWYMNPDASVDNPLVSQTTSVSNNVFYDSKSHGGGYMPTYYPFDGTINHKKNYYGGMAKTARIATAYAGIYNYETIHDYVLGGASYNGGKFTAILDSNTIDNSFVNPLGTDGMIYKIQGGADLTITETNTFRVATLPVLKFNNYMDGLVDDDYSRVEHWMDKQCTKWVNFPPTYEFGYRESRMGTEFETIWNANTSTSANNITIPAKGATVSLTVGTNKAYQLGETLWITSSASPTNRFKGVITAYTPGTGAVTLNPVDSVEGSGTFSSWNVKHELQDIIIRRVYSTGDIVRHLGNFYISLQNNNVSHTPPTTGAYTDSWWKLIVFSNGRTMPPDDVRLKSNDYYALKGIGLSQTVSNAMKYRFKIPANSNLKLKRR